jgi:hypothetical protein
MTRSQGRRCLPALSADGGVHPGDTDQNHTFFGTRLCLLRAICAIYLAVTSHFPHAGPSANWENVVHAFDFGGRGIDCVGG